MKHFSFTDSPRVDINICFFAAFCLFCVLFCSLFIPTYISTWFCFCHSFIVFIALKSRWEFEVISPHARFQFELPRRKKYFWFFYLCNFHPLQPSAITIIFFSTNALFATSRMRFDIKFFRLYSQKILTAEGFIVLPFDQTI